MEEKKAVKKLSYEELENLCGSQSEQLERMYNEVGRIRDAMRQMDLTNLYHRVDFLLRIINDREKYPVAFVDSCVSEVVSVMTLPANEDVGDPETVEPVDAK